MGEGASFKILGGNEYNFRMKITSLKTDFCSDREFILPGEEVEMKRNEKSKTDYILIEPEDFSRIQDLHSSEDSKLVATVFYCQ